MMRKERIKEQEKKDREIAKYIYSILYSGFTQQHKETPIHCSVDLESEVQLLSKYKLRIATEIKELSGNYDCFLLKVEKLNKMSGCTSNVKDLYYMVLNNGTAYIFDCRKIKWSEITHKELLQRDCQFDSNSSMSYYDTYFIPKNKAFTAITYANFIQAQEQQSQ